MKIDIQITGSKEMLRAFKVLQNMKAPIQDLCVRQAQMMEQRGKAAPGTPGATPRDSGDLRKSMMTDPSSATVGYGMEYAPHVEYGHRTRNGGFVPGQHYLQTNVEQQRPIFERETNDYIQAFIDAARG